MNMKKIKDNVFKIIEIIFGYGILLSLFLGGFSFFGYLIAIIIGGDIAITICNVIYNYIYTYIVYGTSIVVLLGILKMYLCREVALSTKKDKDKK